MSGLDRPKLRPLSVRRVEHEGQSLVVLDDPRRFCTAPIVLALDAYVHVVRHFNGRNSLLDVQGLTLQATSQYLEITSIQQLVKQLDQALALEGPSYASAVRAFYESSERPAALAGRSYS